MPIQTLAATLEAAEAGGYAVGAFNVSDLNQAVAVLVAARAERSPVIVQAIAGTERVRRRKLVVAHASSRHRKLSGRHHNPAL